ncbi:hypothetical protein L6164_012482 [Bauhinia variegata]|uniref:Uncharacterized protein n=1 Tax=Bauhinia variegata TaxID=167791 RepID=A0ACB9PAH0_BAUVA|nr:hypothetical protein L6164_012482 [Bauhinia variegata]
MAKIVSLPYVFLLILAMAFLSELVQGGGQGSLRPEQCQGACSYRCSKTHHRERCMFFCIKCCRKCLCVPSGFYGHKEECPCYNNWKTKRGGAKCP